MNLLRKRPATGGPYLIADMNRRHTVFQIVPSALRILREGIEREGSNLSGVAARCSWRPWDPNGAECDSKSNGGGAGTGDAANELDQQRLAAFGSMQQQPSDQVEYLRGVELP